VIGSEEMTECRGIQRQVSYKSRRKDIEVLGRGSRRQEILVLLVEAEEERGFATC